MNRTHGVDRVAGDLVATAQLRFLAEGDPWDYGWSVRDYRRSGKALMSLGDRVAGLPRAGIDQLEQVVGALLKMPEVHASYRESDIWEAIIGALEQVPLELAAGEQKDFLAHYIERLVNPPVAYVVFPLANVASGLLEFENVLIGPLSTEFFQALEPKVSVALDSLNLRDEPWWLRKSGKGIDSDGTQMFAWWGTKQLSWAVEVARTTLDDIVSIALCLTGDLEGRSLFSLRGDSHRPGLRGLVLDRRALARIAASGVSEIENELSSTSIVGGFTRPHSQWAWSGEEPFPLGDLLANSISIVRSLLSDDGVLARRIVTAARWHAKAYWSNTREDAILALGIGFDAILAESGPSPGRALADRYALLEPVPSRRAAAYRRFMNEFYAARSAVVHGAQRSSLTVAFVREMAMELRRLVQRLLNMWDISEIRSEKDYLAAFERLKWGT